MPIVFTTLVLVAPTPEWLGAEVSDARRIVSLAPSATEILFAIGAGDRVVGVTRYDEFPEQVKELPKVGGFIDPDTEAVLSLKPDLVVTVRTSGGRARVDAIARLGVPVLVVPAESIEDMWVAIAALGKAVGRAKAASELAAEVKRTLDRIRKQHSSVPAIRVLLVVGHRPLVVAGPGTYLDRLLRYVAAENVVTRGGAYPSLDLEALVSLDPDAIIDVAMVRSDPGFWERFGAVRAVREGRVVPIRGDALLRAGPRLPAGLGELARGLRP